jgi:hypothetical protein
MAENGYITIPTFQALGEDEDHTYGGLVGASA